MKRSEDVYVTAKLNHIDCVSTVPTGCKNITTNPSENSLLIVPQQKTHLTPVMHCRYHATYISSKTFWPDTRAEGFPSVVLD